MCFVDEYDKIMTQHLTEGFVDHRNFGLAPQAVSKLALHHAESGLHVGPLMVVLQEVVQLGLMPHTPPIVL